MSNHTTIKTIRLVAGVISLATKRNDKRGAGAIDRVCCRRITDHHHRLGTASRRNHVQRLGD